LLWNSFPPGSAIDCDSRFPLFLELQDVI
jgi:hypothetical protein